MPTPNPRFEHVYAIIRVDDPLIEDASAIESVVITKIVRSEDEAKREVARLNRLNAPKGCKYLYQMTRLAQELRERGTEKGGTEKGTEKGTGPNGTADRVI
jgi:hypothetical protein